MKYYTKEETLAGSSTLTIISGRGLDLNNFNKSGLLNFRYYAGDSLTPESSGNYQLMRDLVVFMEIGGNRPTTRLVCIDLKDGSMLDGGYVVGEGVDDKKIVKLLMREHVEFIKKHGGFKSEAYAFESDGVGIVD